MAATSLWVAVKRRAYRTLDWLLDGVRGVLLIRWFVPMAVAVHVSLVGWSAVWHFPTIDEAAHLPAGVSHWQFGKFRLYHVNPPLVRLVAALPVVALQPEIDWSQYSEDVRARPSFGIGIAFIEQQGFTGVWYYTVARWACLVFTLLGAWACYRFAGALYGPYAARLALVIWCFSPTVLANAAMVTPDLGAAACGLAATLFFHRWLNKGNWASAIWCGLWLGLALLTKST